MPSLLHQIGELFLRSVPVAVIVLIFFAVLKYLFFNPLLKVMAEREARTAGAQKEAESAQAVAAEKVKQYEDALRQARAKVYAEQEEARKKVIDQRAAFLKETRTKVMADVGAAKQRIGGEFEEAKKEMAATVSELAAEITGRVLRTPPVPGSPTRETR